MKYIDADKLIHDLEERIFAYSEGYAGGDDCRKDAIETLLKDVRYQCSLQQEQQEVDLERELKKWRHEHFRGERDGHYSGEYLERNSQLEIAHRFYELGKNSK